MSTQGPGTMPRRPAKSPGAQAFGVRSGGLASEVDA